MWHRFVETQESLGEKSDALGRLCTVVLNGVRRLEQQARRPLRSVGPRGGGSDVWIRGSEPA